MDNNIIEIVTPDGTVEKVNLITYLLSDDGNKQYIVYTKSENYGIEDDRIIYIYRFHNIDNVLSVTEITDDDEWNEVQRLLRRIANAK